ncbi:PAS domain-containing protein [Emcibacter sp. SYSU 3D8]|uniref:PAS domain-containing protein n=1 Tax=Emcibacter sp. SYSU 3D8 TaxID=3133969 RepID=UPI0031FE7121
MIGTQQASNGMAARIGAFDWSRTALGTPEGWPAPLRTLVSLMHDSHQPIFMAWGTDRTWLYNDAFAPILGRKHPGALGRPSEEVWGEAWDELGPLFDRVFAGEPVHMNDISLMLDRDGQLEESHFSFSYTPVRGERGTVEGLFGVCIETTSQVLALRREAAAQERRRRLFENAPGFIAILNGPDHVYEFVNTAYRRLLGGRELLGKTVREAVPELADQGFYDLLDRTYASGERYVAHHVPVRLRPSPSDPPETRFLDFIYEPIIDEGGAVTGIFVEGYDVTSVQAAQEGLRANERRQALLFELSDRFRDKSDLADLSHEAGELLGKALGVDRVGYGTVDPIAETITIERDWNAPGISSLAGVLHFRDYGSYIEDLKRGETVVFANAETDPRTAATASALKAISAQSVVNMPVTEHGGLVALLYLNHSTAREWTDDELALIRDVADRTRVVIERRRAERELQALASSLERQVEARTAERDRVWRNSRGLLAVLGLDGRLRAANPAWRPILGYEPAQIAGRLYRDFALPEDIADVDAAFAAAAGGPHASFDTRLRHADGSPRWISWQTAQEGQLIYCYGRDITVEREQAEALRLAEEQLRQAQKMEAVGQLTGGLAHDFNNLLTGISGSLELLQTRVAQGRYKEIERYVAAAQGSAKRAAALTHRLLAFSRRQTLDPRPVNVNRLITGMEDLVRRTVGPEITVEVVCAGGLWTTFADTNQLENALLNLCINARDAMPQGGRLTIETANRWLDGRGARERDLAPGQYISLCVSDTGTGMAPEVIARAFDPFYTTKPLGAGTGLGLSMIYGFARQSGGQARIYSEEGQGATVCLYLPRHLGEDPPDEPGEPVAGIAPAGDGETVLVVDDEPTVRMLVLEVLEELGYHSLEAVDGATALKIIESDARIDLMVTDVGLPGGMNGRQIADAGRQIRPALKVLFITGYAENAVVGNGQLEPGMELLTKPFAMEDLAARIRDLVARP